MRRASTNLISPPLTFLSSRMAARSFCRCGAFSFTLGGQAGALEDALDALHVACGQAEDLRGEPGGGDLADGDRFAMQILAVVRNGFERVADGVAEIQDGPQAALGLVLPNHLRLDLAAAGHDRRQRARVAAQQLRQVALQPLEQPGVVDDAVFDHFGEAGAILAHGQRGERVQVAQHQPRLVERPDEVLARLQVQADLAADGAVHLGEQRRRHLHERPGRAGKSPPRNPPGRPPRRRRARR